MMSLFLVMQTACDERPKNPIAVQGDRMIDAYQRSQALRDAENLTIVRNAIQAYRATNDRYPGNLEDIKSLLSAHNLDLSKYSYNPSDGSVSLRK